MSEDQKQDAKTNDNVSTVARPIFGMSGSVLAAKGPNGESHYVSILDEEVTAPGQYIQLLDTLYNAKAGDTVHIKIYSFGGWVDSGLNIIQAIFNTQAKVITTGMSIVASIAAVIWMCGHERRMLPGSALMVHMPSGGQYGKTADIEDECKQLNEFFSNLLRTIGGDILTEDEFTRIIENREDTFIPAEIINERLLRLKREKGEV